MAKTNWQDPGTGEVRSTHISGLQEAVGKIEESIGINTVTETNIPLTEVYIADNDRYRIFQAPLGKRNWTSEQAPIIKRNGTVISSGFEIDYGGGAIILNVNDTIARTYTADVRYTVKETTNIKTKIEDDISDHDSSEIAHNDIRERINSLASEDTMPHIMSNLKTGKKYKYGLRVSLDGIPQVISEEVI